MYAAATRRALTDLERAHEQRAEMADAGAWEARPGPLCRFCDFQAACPAQRSNPPRPGTADSDDLLRSRGLTQRVSESAVPVSSDLLDVIDADALPVVE